MFGRIKMYFEDRRHDKIRKQKLFLYKLFGFRDPKFDYDKHLKGSFGLCPWNNRTTCRFEKRPQNETVNDYRKATKGK